MGEIPLPYQPGTFCLRLPPELRNDGLAGLAEVLSHQRALEALNDTHRELFKSTFRNLIERTYKGLQDPMIFDRRELYGIIDKGFDGFSYAVKQMLNLEPRGDKGWAYSLTLSRAWTVLDLILQAHKGIEYRDKKAVRFGINKPYPSVLSVFEESGLPLSDFEVEIVSDLCIGTSARDRNKAIDAARQMALSLRESSLAKRSGQTERLGGDFLEVLLSIRYTKPTEKKDLTFYC